MTTAANLSRWLTLPMDHLFIEDWIANKELLNIEDDHSAQGKELELAHLIEQTRTLPKTPELPRGMDFEIVLHGFEPEGLVEYDETVIVAPRGKVEPGKKAVELEMIVDWQTPTKQEVCWGEIFVFPLGMEQSVKLKAKSHGDGRFNGKKEVNWTGKGKARVVVDARGRPIPTAFSRTQREMMEKLRKSQISEEKESKDA